MKSILINIGKGLSLLLFSAIILCIAASACNAAEPSILKLDTTSPQYTTAEVTIDNAISSIEKHVITAAVKGDMDAANKWSQTLLAVHASRYVGPIGDMLASFKEASKSLPGIISAAMEVEGAEPPTSIYDSYFDKSATLFAMKGDVRMFRQALICNKLWRAAFYGDGVELKSDDLLVCRNWIEAGCPDGQLPTALSEVFSKNAKFQTTLKAYRSKLTAAK